VGEKKKGSGRHRAEKTSGETGGATLVPQPHGGAIYSGGVPGHKGAGGRPPSAFRELARRIIEDRGLVQRLADIADGSIGEIVELGDRRIFCSTPIREQRGAIAELLKVGIPSGNEITREDVRVRLAETIRIIRERFDEATSADDLLEAIAPLWTGPK
jgi:hypothetical protein